MFCIAAKPVSRLLSSVCKLPQELGVVPLAACLAADAAAAFASAAGAAVPPEDSAVGTSSCSYVKGTRVSKDVDRCKRNTGYRQASRQTYPVHQLFRHSV